MDRLAANIALLGLITDAPEAASAVVSTPRIEPFSLASLRTISFKHERLISQHLSFVCAYSDDAFHALATCIEEDHPNNRLMIRYAANLGDHKMLMASLNQVTRILQDEARNGLCPLLLSQILLLLTY